LPAQTAAMMKFSGGTGKAARRVEFDQGCVLSALNDLNGLNRRRS